MVSSSHQIEQIRSDSTYPKIQTLWKRDKSNHFCIIPGEFSLPKFQTVSHWRITEKIDGTNIRVVWNGQLSFYGKSAKSEIPPMLQQALKLIFQDKNPLFQQLFGDQETVLYGEGFGGKISGGTIPGQKYQPTTGFILFDVLGPQGWSSWENLQIIAKALEIPLVPSYGVFHLDEAIDLLQNRIMGGEIQSFFGDFIPEGIVATAESLESFNPSLTINLNKFNPNPCIPLKWKLKVRDYQQLAHVKK